MNGLYVYSIVVAGSLLALVIWIWRRYDIPPSRQVEIAFFFGGFTICMGTLISLFSPFQGPVRQLAQQNRKTALRAAPSNNRTFFKKFFGAPQPSGPAQASAVPEGGALDSARRITSGPLPGLDRWTAVYDISAHTVFLPDGKKLEAHSGVGDKLDDPRFVHIRMRGATPPHVYELALREQPFRGVRALRLKPVGDGNIFGRAGFLAHTYMLGPNGDSNGCVAFKDYNAFLQAFQNGEVKRLVVVPHLD